MFKPLSTQGQPIPPGQQHVDCGNLIVGRLGEGDEEGQQCRAQPDQFKVQSQQDSSGLDGDRMVGERKAELGIER